MKLSMILISISCIFGSIHSYPFDTMDVSEESSISVLEETFGNVKKEMMGCSMMTLASNVDKNEVNLKAFWKAESHPTVSGIQKRFGTV